MRATVDAKEFSQVLDKVSKAAKRSIEPELEGVQVQIAGGRCTLTATDMTTWFSAKPVGTDDKSLRILEKCHHKSTAKLHEAQRVH